MQVPDGGLMARRKIVVDDGCIALPGQKLGRVAADESGATDDEDVVRGHYAASTSLPVGFLN